MGRLISLIVFMLVFIQLLDNLLSEAPESVSPMPSPVQPPQLSEREREQRTWDAKLRGALSLFGSDTGQQGPAEGVVEVLANGRRMDTPGLRRLLGAEARRSAFFVYRFHGIEAASASALGLDREHHFVNAYLEGYSPFRTDNVFVPLSVLARKKTYMLDNLNHGGDEVWQTSRQAYWFTRGDCEDHAIALADWLIDMGEDARVALGTYKGGGHAWVVLIKEGQEFVLEATQKNGLTGLKRYPLASAQPDYQPQYQFNRTHFWANVGALQTTRYQGRHWLEKSRFYRQ